MSFGLVDRMAAVTETGVRTELSRDAAEGSRRRGLRELCGLLGHELRNPLAAATASLAALDAMTSSEDPRQRFIGHASEALERLSDLLGTYLAFGRGCRPVLRRVAIADLLETVAARSRGIEVLTAGESLGEPAVEAAVDADPDLLGRALDNLIENARNAGACRVRLRCLPSGTGQVRLAIDDDGPGIAAGFEQVLFEPFVSARDGSGLGLAIVREVIRAHRGEIRLARASGVTPWRGARFVLELPRSRTDGSADAPPSDPGPAE